MYITSMPLGKDETPGMPADDLLEALSSDLEIPMLLNGEGSPGFDESPDEIMKAALEGQTIANFEDYGVGFESPATVASDEFDRIFEQGEEFRMELSGGAVRLPPSPSPSQSESSSGFEWQSEGSIVHHSDVKYAIETPPISPPQNESPPISPPPAQNDTKKDLPKIKLLPLNALGLKGTMPKFILANNNPAKRICIQPKIEQSKETPRKTIVLSPQDFAALTQKVKQNSGNQPLKVQTLPMSKHVKIQNQLNLLPVQQNKSNNITNTNTTSPMPKNIKIINGTKTVQINPQSATVSTLSNPITTNEVKLSPQIVVKNDKIISQPIVIKNDIPVCPPIVIKKENVSNGMPVMIKNEFPEFIDFQDRQESEIKALKRQQRMIKNRESACLSRKKKKEYVTSLENQISELKERNQQLEMENAELKKRLSAVDGTNSIKFGSKNYSINKKNSAILLAMVFMVSLNFGSFGSNVFNHNRQPLGDIRTSVPSISLANVRHGRSLLWANSVEEERTDSKENLNDTLPVIPITCSKYINQTESRRIYLELSHLTGGEGKKNSSKPFETYLEVKLQNKLHKVDTNDAQNKNLSNENLKLLKKKSFDLNDASSKSSYNAVQVFSPLLKEYVNLFDILGKKDDTFYIVYFTAKHLLFPASRTNNTIRPKISLVLPTVPTEGSFSTQSDSITMMQIDCEVTNTQLLDLQKTLIPKHLRNQQTENEPPKHDNTNIYEDTSNIMKKYNSFLPKTNNTNSLLNDNIVKKEFNNSFQFNNAKYNSYTEKKEEKIKQKKFTNQTEEMKKTNNSEDRRIFRRKRHFNFQ